jgi:hypothetical protein
MATELRAYNAQGEQLFITPDADGPQFEEFDTVGDAFDRMEALKSAWRWDRERAGYVAADGFVRNRIAYFRLDDEEWSRAQVAAHAQERAARKAALAQQQGAEEAPQEAERAEDTTARRRELAASRSANSYEPAADAVRAFVREMAPGGDLRVRVTEGAEVFVSREDLHAMVYDNAGAEGRAQAAVRIREAVAAHVDRGERAVHMMFPSNGMRPALYLGDVMALLNRWENDSRSEETARTVARSVWRRADGFVPVWTGGVLHGWTFAVAGESDVRYGWATGRPNSLSSAMWSTREAAESSLKGEPVTERTARLARLDRVFLAGYATSPPMTHEERRIAAGLVADRHTQGGTALFQGRDRAQMASEYVIKDPYDLMNAYGWARLDAGAIERPAHTCSWGCGTPCPQAAARA